MKKRLLAMLFIILFLCAGAQAEMPTGGVRHIAIRLTPSALKGDARGDDGPKIVGPSECVTGTEYTWNFSGFSDNVIVDMAVMDGSYAQGWADIMYEQTGDYTDFSYTFYFPGLYYLFVTDNNTGAELYIRIDVADGGDNIVLQMIREVKAENPKTGEYERARWFYDWVLDHCEYDENYQYYDAASLFLRGTGVCNSYVRALAKLLEEDGIDYRRVTGKAFGGGHTWIAIKLDGVWCLSDPTWDDQYTEAYDIRYDFYGMTEALFAIEHENPYYVGGEVTCDSLANNYYVRDGRWQEDAAEALSTYQSQRESGYHNFLMPRGIKITFDDYYNITMHGEVTAWGLNHTDWQDDQGRSFRPEFVYDWDAVTLIGRDPSGGTLNLPQSLKAVEAESFAVSAANHVVVPSGCTAIESGAFEDMDLWEIVVPDSVASIDEDAFKGCDSVFIVASEDSTAAAFAKDHGIPTWPDCFA